MSKTTSLLSTESVALTRRRSLSRRVTLSLLGCLLGSVAAHASAALKIGTDLTYPPYNYMDGAQPAGFDTEFMRLVAGSLNTSAQFMDTRFANLIMGVNTNKFDVIASTLYVTPERAKQIDYLPYMKTGGVLLALKGGSFAPTAPEQLCGKKVSSIQGAAWIAKLAEVSKTVCAAKGLSAIDVREFPTSPEASQAVLSKAVDAQFEDAAVAQAAAEKSGKLVVTSAIIYPVVVGLGLKKGESARQQPLIDAVNKTLASPEYQSLLKKYNVAAPSDSDVKAALAGTL